MTYKALRRKEDKQWIELTGHMFDPDFTECETPAKVNNELKFDNIIETWPEFNWSIYELVTVHVIAEDELPSDEDVIHEATKIYPETDIDEVNKLQRNLRLSFRNGFNYFKSQILKP